MSRISEPLDALVSSRICHDLAGAMGAVTNSFELMQLTGQIQSGSEEYGLIEDSLSLLIQRLQLFRLAFGPASNQPTSLKELGETLKMQFTQRTTLTMPDAGSITRANAKCLALSMMCISKNLTNGGDVSMQQIGSDWYIKANGPIKPLPEWDLLEDKPGSDTMESNICEFAVLARCQRDGQCRIRISAAPDALTLILTLQS